MASELLSLLFKLENYTKIANSDRGYNVIHSNLHIDFKSISFLDQYLTSYRGNKFIKGDAKEQKLKTRPDGGR